MNIERARHLAALLCCAGLALADERALAASAAAPQKTAAATSSAYRDLKWEELVPKDWDPAAMWWAIITLTTVGYGDVTPVTPFGRVIAGLVAVVGLMMFALPTAILGAGWFASLLPGIRAYRLSLVDGLSPRV